MEVKGSEMTVLEAVLESDVELKLLNDQKDRLEKMQNEGAESIDEVGGDIHASMKAL